MTNVADPRGLAFQRWAATMVQDNALSVLPIDEREWRVWARTILQSVPGVPNPDGFLNWQDWALAWKRST